MLSLGDSLDGMAASGQSMTLMPNTTSGLPVSVPNSLVIADRLVLNVAPRSNDGRSAPSDSISGNPIPVRNVTSRSMFSANIPTGSMR